MSPASTSIGTSSSTSRPRVPTEYEIKQKAVSLWAKTWPVLTAMIDEEMAAKNLEKTHRLAVHNRFANAGWEQLSQEEQLPFITTATTKLQEALTQESVP